MFSSLLCFHELANCSSHLIDLEILCFHALVSCFFCKCFVFTSIQIAGGAPQRKKLLCALCICGLPAEAGKVSPLSIAASFALLPLFFPFLSFVVSSFSLFYQIAGGGVALLRG